MLGTSRFVSAFAAVASMLALASAECADSPKPMFAAPVLGDGWEASIVATNLSTPRGIVFDKVGNLVVCEQSSGLSVLRLTDNGGACVSGKAVRILDDDTLTHGLEISPDGKTLYASSISDLFAWDYDDQKLALSNKRTIISGMDSLDHTTRTLLLSKTNPKIMFVSRGSAANLDMATQSKDSGRSMIKSFDISVPGKVYDYTADGEVIGWGLRNDIGVAEHPVTSGIWAVENSSDDVKRFGVDVHEENPAEKLNFLGYANGKAHPNWGSNFGYPFCFSAWNPESFQKTPTNEFAAKAEDIQVGVQFVMEPNATYSDAFCKKERTSPRLVFEPHTAPIDIKFNGVGNIAYVSFHGSWDKTSPSGYKMSWIQFKDGEPVEPLTSQKALNDIIWNKDNSVCPDSCFRPTGIAIDHKERVFMASDGSGEVWVLQKTGAPKAMSAKFAAHGRARL